MVFFFRGGHRDFSQSASFANLIPFAESLTLGSLGVAVFNKFAWDSQLPRSIIVIDWAFSILALGVLKGSVRLYRERYYPMFTANSAVRVLVVSASEAGETLVREVQRQTCSPMKVVGILDPDSATHGRILSGVRVLGGLNEIERIAAIQRVTTILIPTPAIAAREIRALVVAGKKSNLKVQIVPGFGSLLAGTLTVRPRDVDIQDLLCREPVKLETETIEGFLRGKTVLITGAAGSIGSEMCRQVAAFEPRRIILLDHNENGVFFIERELKATFPQLKLIPYVASITDSVRLRKCFVQHEPDVVFHAAAHKHVPMMESNPGEALKNNVLGTRALVDEAMRAKVEAFVMISTDKAVNPTSVMGASKRLAEMYVQAHSHVSTTRLMTVRFGNVLGSNGSVVPIFKKQIQDGGPVTVTHPKMVRYFMTIPEAAQLVLQAGALGTGGEIFVLDMGKPVKIVDLARDLIRLSGVHESSEIDLVFTGLRPGEKLYEELYEDSETKLSTRHPKIFAANHRPCSIESIREKLDRLACMVDQPNRQVLTALKELLPDYKPRSLQQTDSTTTTTAISEVPLGVNGLDHAQSELFTSSAYSVPR
jgi:FlaA1/EpsC-like NDP-sugar epimerase